ncbi:MAG: hypothetical protein ABSC22_20645, partial [Roseiarcus sp.]
HQLHVGAVDPLMAISAALASALRVRRTSRAGNAFADVAALASTGAATAYFVQGKGFAYHA